MRRIWATKLMNFNLKSNLIFQLVNYLQIDQHKIIIMNKILRQTNKIYLEIHFSSMKKTNLQPYSNNLNKEKI